jgi:broad specificity phosphatase PhoE
MKIILLRHEKRSWDCRFFSSLTEEGMLNSLLLPDKLDKLNIDIIFSSPFIRTLQTIYPYCCKNNLKINVENGLYEYIHNPIFLLDRVLYTKENIDDNDLLSIINPYYSSIVNKSDFSVLEDEVDLERRIIKFFNYLIKNYNNKTVLLVTHRGVCNKIKNLYFKETDMESEFPMGSFFSFRI